MKLKFGEEIEQHLIDHNGHQLGEIFSILAIIPACRGGSCGWQPSSCKPCLPFFVSFCCFVHFLTLLFVSLLLTWLYFSVIEVKLKEVVTATVNVIRAKLWKLLEQTISFQWKKVNLRLKVGKDLNGLMLLEKIIMHRKAEVVLSWGNRLKTAIYDRDRGWPV